MIGKIGRTQRKIESLLQFGSTSRDCPAGNTLRSANPTHDAYFKRGLIAFFLKIEQTVQITTFDSSGKIEMPKLGKWDVARSYSVCFVQKMTRRISKKSLVSLTFFALISMGSSAAFGQVPIVKLDGSVTDPSPAPPIITVMRMGELKPAKPGEVPIVSMANGEVTPSLPPIVSSPGSMIPSIDVPIVGMKEEGLAPTNNLPRLTTFSEPSFGNVTPQPIIVQESPASPSDMIIEMKKEDFRRRVPSVPIMSSSSSRSGFTGSDNGAINNAPQRNLVPVTPMSSRGNPSQSYEPRQLPNQPEMPQPIKLEKNREVINPFAKASKSTTRQDAPAPIAQAPIEQDISPTVETDTLVQEDITISQDLGFIDAPVTANVPNVPSSPSLVLMGEALFMTAESRSVTVADSFGLDAFDYDMGIRITGQRVFGAEGLSISYAGIQEWNDSFNTPLSPGGGLNFTPVAGTGLGATALAPFKDAVFQQQYHNGNYHTLELNKVTWGWDVLNIFLGVRYTHYEEEFDFFSARADGQQGLLALDLENHIFGPQVGGELFYDIGGRVSTGVKGKLGLMATALERETRLISNGTSIINNTDSDVNFNFMAEFGGFVRWQVLPRGYIRGGYELWYNSSVFGADANIPGSITSNYGTTSVDDDLLIHGATIGFEFNW